MPETATVKEVEMADLEAELASTSQPSAKKDGKQGEDGDVPAANILAAKNVWLYVLFMLVYTISTTAGRNYNSSSWFAFTNHVRDAFTETPNVQFVDVGSVKEYYSWLQSDFLDAAFSPNTFDGPERRADFKAGYTLSFGKIIGGMSVDLPWHFSLSPQRAGCDC